MSGIYLWLHTVYVSISLTDYLILISYIYLFLSHNLILKFHLTPCIIAFIVVHYIILCVHYSMHSIIKFLLSISLRIR